MNYSARKERRRALLFAVFIVLAATAVCGKKGAGTLPPRQGMVNDFAAIVGAGDLAALEASLGAYEKETCHEFVVLIVPSLGGKKIETLSSEAMEAWGIGRDPLERGLLLTLSVEEGKGRIDAGSGLEKLVLSGTAQQALQGEMFPLFAEEKFAEGIRRGLAILMEEGRALTYPPELRPPVCRQPSR